MQGLDEKHTINDKRLKRKKSQFQFLFYEMKKEGKEAEAQNNEDKGFSFPTFSSL